MKNQIFNQLNEPLLLDEIENSGTYLSFKTGETIVKNEKFNVYPTFPTANWLNNIFDIQVQVNLKFSDVRV